MQRAFTKRPYGYYCALLLDIGDATVDGWPIFVPYEIGIHPVLGIDGHQRAPWQKFVPDDFCIHLVLRIDGFTAVLQKQYPTAISNSNTPQC